MATADQNHDLPEGTAPLGSLQAYSEAYQARYKPGDHIGGHLAGLRAVVLLDRQRRTPGWRGMEADENRIAAWVIDRFGPDSLANPMERADRLLEEAIEMQQAIYAECSTNLDVDGHGRARALVDHVYSKPPGNSRKEVGGVGTCLLALCRRIGVRLDHATQAELTRIEALPREHFDARHQAKVDAGVAAQHDRLTPNPKA